MPAWVARGNAPPVGRKTRRHPVFRPVSSETGPFMGPSAVGPVSALQIAAVSSLGQLLPSPPFSYMTQNGLCIDVSILVGRGGELGPGRSVRRQRAETRRLPERPTGGAKNGTTPQNHTADGGV